MKVVRQLAGLTIVAVAVLALDALVARAMIEYDVAGSLLSAGGKPEILAVALVAVAARLGVVSLVIVPALAVLVLTAKAD